MGDLPDTNFIEKWTEADRTHEQNKSLKGNGDFLGPNPKRFCTDIFCLILFLLMNCGLAGAVYYIIVTGDVDRLGHGSDFRGDVCGKSGLSNKPFTYFPEPSDTTIVLCISSCPSNVQSKSICYYDTDYVTELPVWGCWDSISCTEFAYYCLPKGKTDRLSVLNVFFYDQNLIKRGAGDVIYTWEIICIGAIFALVIALAFLFVFSSPHKLSRFITYCQVQNTVLWGLITGLVYYNSYLFHQTLCTANNNITPDYCYTTAEFGLQVLSYVLFFGLIIYVIILIAMRKNIPNAIQLIKITAEPMNQIKSLYSVPILLILIGLVLVAGCFLLVLWTLSIGEIVSIGNNNVPGGAINNLQFQSRDKAVLVVVLMMCLWWMSALMAFAEFVMGGVIGSWFFTKEKSTIFSPVSKSVHNCLRFHLGSVVRGGFYNLFFALPNFFLGGICEILKKHSKNCCFLTAAYCCCPCLSLYQRSTKYNTKHSYIYLSIFALPYDLSSKQCYFLMQRNSQRIKSPLKSLNYLIFQVKLSICLMGLFASYIFLTFSPTTLLNFPTTDLSSTLAPSLFTFTVCIFLSEIVGGCMSACVNSFAICSILNEEMFTAEQRFINTEMQIILDQASSETRNNDLNPKIVQKPGRSNRVPMNLIEFDKDFQVKVTPLKADKKMRIEEI